MSSLGKGEKAEEISFFELFIALSKVCGSIGILSNSSNSAGMSKLWPNGCRERKFSISAEVMSESLIIELPELEESISCTAFDI